MPVLFSSVRHASLVLLVPLPQAPVAQEPLLRQQLQCRLLSACQELQGR